MTREEAIIILKDCELNPCVPKDTEAVDMAIKSLEQESVIDKIRAEIKQERIGYPPSADYYKAIMKCLQIIDKYKESEEK